MADAAIAPTTAPRPGERPHIQASKKDTLAAEERREATARKRDPENQESPKLPRNKPSREQAQRAAERGRTDLATAKEVARLTRGPATSVETCFTDQRGRTIIVMKGSKFQDCPGDASGGYFVGKDGSKYHITGTTDDGKAIVSHIVKPDGSIQLHDKTSPPKVFSHSKDQILRQLNLRKIGENQFVRTGYGGDYKLQFEKDGSFSVHYSGGTNTRGRFRPAQTFHHGRWDMGRRSSLRGADQQAKWTQYSAASNNREVAIDLSKVVDITNQARGSGFIASGGAITWKDGADSNWVKGEISPEIKAILNRARAGGHTAVYTQEQTAGVNFTSYSFATEINGVSGVLRVANLNGAPEAVTHAFQLAKSDEGQKLITDQPLTSHQGPRAGQIFQVLNNGDVIDESAGKVWHLHMRKDANGNPFSWTSENWTAPLKAGTPVASKAPQPPGAKGDRAPLVEKTLEASVAPQPPTASPQKTSPTKPTSLDPSPSAQTPPTAQPEAATETMPSEPDQSASSPNQEQTTPTSEETLVSTQELVPDVDSIFPDARENGIHKETREELVPDVGEIFPTREQNAASIEADTAPAQDLTLTPTEQLMKIAGELLEQGKDSGFYELATDSPLNELIGKEPLGAWIMAESGERVFAVARKIPGGSSGVLLARERDMTEGPRSTAYSREAFKTLELSAFTDGSLAFEEWTTSRVKNSTDSQIFGRLRSDGSIELRHDYKKGEQAPKGFFGRRIVAPYKDFTSELSWESIKAKPSSPTGRAEPIKGEREALFRRLNPTDLVVAAQSEKLLISGEAIGIYSNKALDGRFESFGTFSETIAGETTTSTTRSGYTFLRNNKGSAEIVFVPSDSFERQSEISGWFEDVVAPALNKNTKDGELQFDNWVDVSGDGMKAEARVLSSGDIEMRYTRKDDLKEGRGAIVRLEKGKDGDLDWEHHDAWLSKDGSYQTPNAEHWDRTIRPVAEALVDLNLLITSADKPHGYGYGRAATTMLIDPKNSSFMSINTGHHYSRKTGSYKEGKISTRSYLSESLSKLVTSDYFTLKNDNVSGLSVRTVTGHPAFFIFPDDDGKITAVARHELISEVKAVYDSAREKEASGAGGYRYGKMKTEKWFRVYDGGDKAHWGWLRTDGRMYVLSKDGQTMRRWDPQNAVSSMLDENRKIMHNWLGSWYDMDDHGFRVLPSFKTEQKWLTDQMSDPMKRKVGVR